MGYRNFNPNNLVSVDSFLLCSLLRHYTKEFGEFMAELVQARAGHPVTWPPKFREIKVVL